MEDNGKCLASIPYLHNLNADFLVIENSLEQRIPTSINSDAPSTIESSDDATPGAYDEVQTLYVKLPSNRKIDLKLEHYDDFSKDNSFQSSWAGLDSLLIDEEFLFLDGKEADKIYAQLKQRQTRRRNQEETERRFKHRMA